MAGYIARAIMNAEKRTTGNGLVLYNAYFVKLDTWDKYQPETDLLLIAEGYEFCIPVAETTTTA